MTRDKFKFCTQDNIESIYTNTLELSKRFFSKIYTDLKVHDIHKDSLGYWPSTPEILKRSSIQYEMPNLTNSLVVPFYLSDMKLAHLRIITPKDSGGYDITGIGPTPNGWFNLINSNRVYQTNHANDKEFRLPVYDSLLSAVNKDYGVHSVIINDQNLSALKTFALRLSVVGHNDFLGKFEKIEGFDISVNKTAMSITEFSHKSFCFEDLLGLDMRAVVPLAENYLESIPVYERLKFNSTFMDLFKLDLRSVAPYLFEHHLAEKKVVSNLRDRIALDFKLESYKTDEQGKYVLNLAHRHSEFKERVLLAPSSLSEFFSLFYGDLIEFCFTKEVGGLPTSYLWDTDKKVRLSRVDTFEKVSRLVYITILGLLKGKFDAKE